MVPFNRCFFHQLTITLLLTFLNFHLKSQPAGQTSFEGFADETVFTQASWVSSGFSVPWVNGFNQNRAHIDNAFARSGSNSLRIFFPQGQYGPSNSGAQAPLMVPASSQYYISYWVRFSDNFSWGTTNEGGKLPGLSGGGRCSGCATCNGTNGFSARLMWRTDGAAVLYLYHMDKSGACGDNLNLQITPGVNFKFQKGQWYNIIERVKINTGNNYDGEVQLWVNQQHALSVNGIRFVNNGDQVDNLYFSTFHGGNDPSWVPTTNCYIWFDDIVISTNSADVFTSLGIKDHLPFFGKSENSNQSITVSPQPLERSSVFTVQGIDPNDPVQKMEWVNMMGVIRKEQLIISPLDEYQTPDLESGLYVLRVYLQNQVVSSRVFIK